MTFLAIPYPNIDPVAFALGPITIKWYGLAYLAGFILGWFYIRRLVATQRIWAPGKPPFPSEKVDDLLLYFTLGTVLGGRLGYVLLYEPATYLSSPLDVLAVWKGGMSFHGALIGCGIACWLFSRANRADVWSTLDLCTATVPLGLTFGRLANFINGELFGRVTDVPWAMIFPHAKYLYPAVEPALRHPSQLYESALEGVALFLFLRYLTHRRHALATPGTVTGFFLVGYGLARSFCEIFREPHASHMLNIGPLTAGQVYSIPMIFLGLLVLWRVRAMKPA